jgi:hypothetical protein
VVLVQVSDLFVWSAEKSRGLFYNLGSLVVDLAVRTKSCEVDQFLLTIGTPGTIALFSDRDNLQALEAIPDRDAKMIQGIRINSESVQQGASDQSVSQRRQHC